MLLAYTARGFVQIDATGADLRYTNNAQFAEVTPSMHLSCTRVLGMHFVGVRITDTVFTKCVNRRQNVATRRVRRRSIVTVNNLDLHSDLEKNSGTHFMDPDLDQSGGEKPGVR